MLFLRKQTSFNAVINVPPVGPSAGQVLIRAKYRNTRDTLYGNDYREQGSHARGVYLPHSGYLTHGNSMGDTKIIAKEKSEI